MNKLILILSTIKNWFSNTFENIFSSRKKTLKFIALFVFTVLFLTQIYIILVNNSFYNCRTDDIQQYYTAMVGFINSLKSGSLSWYNLNNYFGATIFADTYYIPIDVFTGITFSLSYLMPVELAYSVTELIKMFAGVMVFAYYFSLKGMKNRTIFWMSMLYFISGGTVSFMAFPVFLSLSFYLPLSLVVIHFFMKKKRWIVPLFALAAMLFDFFLGYRIMAFICIAFLIEYFKEPNFKLKKFIPELISFVALLLLGVLMSAIIVAPSIMFIYEDAYVTYPGFDSYTLSIFGLNMDFFTPQIYIRILAKIFTGQVPTGFYGFERTYAFEHASLYISIIGFIYMNYVFFMRDKTSRIYKIAIVLGALFILFPVFSYVFSGSLESPYTRWINMYSVFQIMILAHVFDKHGFEKVKMKYVSIICAVLLVLLAFLIYFYAFQLNTFDLRYVQETLASGDMIAHYQADPIISFFFSEDGINEILITNLKGTADVLTVDMILMCVSGGFILVLLVFGWLKKWTVVKWFLWIEIIVAFGYMFSGALSSTNQIENFGEFTEIEEFLDDSIDDDSFFRVYLDIESLDISSKNINRLTGYTTNNGEIFFSWNDKETDDIAGLLLGKWTEPKASKKEMNYYSYYLNHFLGYKYILVGTDSGFNFDGDYFDIVAANQDFQLYEINYVTGFSVYDSYMTYDEFSIYRVNNADAAIEKILLMTALIDVERYVEEEFNLEHYIPANEPDGTDVNSYTLVASTERVDIAGVTDETVREFYKYSNEDMMIVCEAGATYIKASSTYISSGDYGEVFMELEDGSTKACYVMDDDSNEDYQIKCGEFFSTPVAIYIEVNEEIFYAPTLKVRTEAIYDRAAYMSFDISELELETFTVIMNYEVDSNFDLDKSFVVDEQGNQYPCAGGIVMFSSQPVKLFAYKTSDMYSYYNLYALSLSISYEEINDLQDYLEQEISKYEMITIENGKISLSYENESTSTYDQIIVIPITYSEEWVITSNIQYETLSVSGGFLGIIVPNGTSLVQIDMEFVPKGLNYGTYGTLAGFAIYLGLFLPGWIKKKRKDGDDLECNTEE